MTLLPVISLFALSALVLLDIALRVYELCLFRRYRAEIDREGRANVYLPAPIVWRWGVGRITGTPARDKKKYPV